MLSANASGRWDGTKPDRTIASFRTGGSVVDDFLTDQHQGVGREGRLHALAVALFAINLVTAVIGFDALDLPALGLELVFERLSRLPIGHGGVAARAGKGRHSQTQHKTQGEKGSHGPHSILVSNLRP